MSKREDTRWERRERKYKKRRYGMRVSGRSVRDVLLRLIGRKAEPAPGHTKAGRPGKPPSPRDPVRTGKRKRRKKRR